MGILNDFSVALGRAVGEYEKDNPKMSRDKAKQVEQIKQNITKSITAMALRQTMLAQVESMWGGPLSFIVWLDWNSLRRGLRLVLEQEQFSMLNLLITENSEMHAERGLLITKISELQTKIDGGQLGENTELNGLQHQVDQLRQEIKDMTQQTQRYQLENQLLSEQVTQLEAENNVYKEKLMEAEQRASDFHQKYLQKLHEVEDLQQQLAQAQAGMDNMIYTTAEGSLDGYAKFH